MTIRKSAIRLHPDCPLVVTSGPGLACTPGGVRVTIRLSGRELATVLAALRYWQRALARTRGEAPVLDHFDGKDTPLTAEEIDRLCERLNCGPTDG
jgi:hypothetical protein